MKPSLRILSLLALAWVPPCRADLIPISGNAGLSGLGSFEGSLAYSATDATHATLTVVLKNTSPVGNGGYLTAFAFNNPAGSITGVSFSGPANFGLLGGSPFADGVNAAPFGQFDLGASTGSGFEGGGPPSKGLAVGQSGTFLFTLIGNGLDQFGAGRFLSELSVPPGDGKGHKAFVARFRGFADGGSDKVPYVPPEPRVIPQETPEPGTLALGGTALAILAWWRRRPRAGTTP